MTPAGRASPIAQQLVGDPGRGGVDRVVKGVDRDLPRCPEDSGRGDVEGGQGHLRASPDGGAVRGGRGARRQTEGIEQATYGSPAGAVTPVREVVEPRVRDLIGEGGDPERFGGGTRRRRAWLAVAEPRLERAG